MAFLIILSKERTHLFSYSQPKGANPANQQIVAGTLNVFSLVVSRTLFTLKYLLRLSNEPISCSVARERRSPSPSLHLGQVLGYTPSGSTSLLLVAADILLGDVMVEFSPSEIRAFPPTAIHGTLFR